MKGRWTNGTYVLGGSVVGTILQGAGDDWFAHGCLEDWEDVKLGCYDDETKARQAVEEWVEDHA